MFARLFLVGAFLCTPLFFTLAQPSYVGVKSCGMCHKSEKSGQQLSIWEGSKHSKAFEVLLSDEANKIATEKGFTTKASETPGLQITDFGGLTTNGILLRQSSNVFCVFSTSP